MQGRRVLHQPTALLLSECIYSCCPHSPPVTPLGYFNPRRFSKHLSRFAKWHYPNFSHDGCLPSVLYMGALGSELQGHHMERFGEQNRTHPQIFSLYKGSFNSVFLFVAIHTSNHPPLTCENCSVVIMYHSVITELFIQHGADPGALTQISLSCYFKPKIF